MEVFDTKWLEELEQTFRSARLPHAEDNHYSNLLTNEIADTVHALAFRLGLPNAYPPVPKEDK